MPPGFSSIHSSHYPQSLQDELERVKAQMSATEAFREIAITHLGLDGRWLKVPEHFCQFLGYSWEELRSLTIWELTHPADLSVEQELNNRLLGGELRSIEMEKRYRTREGREVWVALNRCVVHSPDGKPLHFLSVQRDITAQRNAQKEQEVLSSLAVELSAAETLEAAAFAVRRATECFWRWDAFHISARHAGQGDFRVILRVDRAGSEEQTDFRGSHGTRLDEALAGGPLLINRAAGETGAPDLPLNRFGDNSRPSASLLFAPIRNRGELTGVLSVQSYTPGFFGEADLPCLLRVADTIAPALERIRAEQMARERDALYRDAISVSGAVPYQFNYVSDSYDFVGEAIEEMTGYTAAEITPSLWRALIQEVQTRGETATRSLKQALEEVRQGEVQWLADIRIRTSTGETRWISDSAVPLANEHGTVWGSLGILQDVTDRKRAEEEALLRNFRDALTGVANRTLLVNQLDQAISRAARRSEYLFAIVFLGLDRFGLINESLGHGAGDTVLRQVASRLEKALRPGDTVARFSGDEFVLLLDDLREPDGVVRVIEKVSTELSVPVRVEEHELSVSASCGIVTSAPHYSDPGDMLRDAGNALRRAKSRGRARYEFFDTGMHRSVMASLELENDLRRALAANELLLFYQPILSVATGRITGLEALLRWKHPERGWISPADFIPIAEESDQIIPIGRWVLSEAAAQLATWNRMFPGAGFLSVSINLSAQQFVSGDLPSHILSAADDSDIAHGSLNLEITESVLMHNQEQVLRQLQDLKRADFSLHLDDFGTGYSSLAYLHSFPIDVLKIDRSFVARMGPEGRECEIVRSIVALAQSLNMKITAEGVESEAQLTVLHDLGCTSAQGFLFSRPLPAEEATRLLEKELA